MQNVNWDVYPPQLEETTYQPSRTFDVQGSASPPTIVADPYLRLAIIDKAIFAANAMGAALTPERVLEFAQEFEAFVEGADGK